ncbi:DNA mismatch repair endonuclease MutL [Ruminococcus sp. 5_1_39BFAA]|uniref:DNA mismatch repair endonuclease MutL n=1 Tax=Ruminococcus sp. 5_1_39BFAA TaxID=457412 RepID=UPI0035676E78
MRKIAVLDQHTIDKIAAGEVVERPSSVVKELVENSIDAGATAVTVEISDGGKKLIRITDNGSGMEADQVPVAFLSHATSKIEKVEDLENIVSLGFRGEALSSIAAVSQVELITKTPAALSGVRYVIEGGVQQKIEEMGAPEGTTFLVRNLFYNTPARSKFLKSDMTEANYIASLMEQLALSHPEISFKYIQNKQVKLHTSGNYSVKDVIYNIYGRDITKSLMEVSYENDFMKVEGYAGKPEISRGNRTFENYYVNGRYVKNNIITKAIEDAYKGFVMQHKFPFVSLHIQMTGNDLDVNVHPRKLEVRFARGTEVYEGIYEAVRKALTHREMIPVVPVGREGRPEKSVKLKTGAVPEPFEVKRREQTMPAPQPVQHTAAPQSVRPQPASTQPSWDMQRASVLREKTEYQNAPFTKEEEELFDGSLRNPVKKATEANLEPPVEKAAPIDSKIESINQNIELASQNATPAARKLESAEEPEHKSLQTEKMPEMSMLPEPEASEAQPKQLELFEEKLLAPESRSRHKLIGQLFDTYWLVEFENNFYIIDQHAAHEKVYYERFVKKFKEQTIESQYLSPPLVVTLNMEEEALLNANQKYFQEFGFEIEPFGGKEYCISAVPSNLYGFDEESLFLEMLDHLAGEGAKDALDLFTARLATMACKAAVKGNHKLSPMEADKLIDELLTLENPYHCPHGRPTIIAMTKTEIEKKFKRIV